MVSLGPNFLFFSPFRDKNFRLDPQKFYLHVWTRSSAPQPVAPSFLTWQSRVAPSSARKKPQTAFSLRAFLLFCSFQTTAAAPCHVSGSPPPARPGPAPARRREPRPRSPELARGRPSSARSSSARARSPPPTHYRPELAPHAVHCRPELALSPLPTSPRRPESGQRSTTARSGPGSSRPHCRPFFFNFLVCKLVVIS
jgi:hypothetical protein